METTIEQNLSALIEQAKHPQAAELTSFGIVILANGALEVWLEADQGSYGCWDFGQTGGDAIGDFSLSREELLSMDVQATAKRLASYLAQSTC